MTRKATGSNPRTAPIVEGSHAQVLGLLEELRGGRPAGDRERWRQNAARMLRRRGAAPETGPKHRRTP